MQMSEDQSEVIAFLENPATHGGRAVERISTHSAHVFLAGDRAYKLKRAVQLPFLDFSTAEKRRVMLETELEINKRTAPRLYTGVIPICRRPTGDLAFSDGPPVDWILVMKRFPQDALFDSMAAANALTNSMIDRLADAVVEMHRTAEIVVAPSQLPFERMALDNISALRNTALDQAAVAELESDLRGELSALADHLRMRAAGGFVRRLHGDLHLGNVALVDGQPTPFDALEFDPALATGDVYYDLAFLLMDLEHRNLRAMANRLLSRYVLLTGDFGGLRALPLFLAVRAAIRAKVLLLGAKPDEAPSYLEAGKDYLPADSPRIIAVGGLSGTGKSRLAMDLAPELGPSPGAIVLRSDVIRKQLCGVGELSRLTGDFYSAEITARVYATLVERAKEIVKAGYSVIVDAVFAQPGERKTLEDVATAIEIPFCGLWLEAGLDIRIERVGTRTADASDADKTVVNAQKTYDLGKMTWRRCDANGRPETVLNEVRKILGRST